MIPFTRPYAKGNSEKYITDAIKRNSLSGDGFYTKKSSFWLEKNISCSKALLTHSCTAALEMAAILLDIQPGDEVIMPSYTFVSTANAFVLRGAIPVFVEIRKDNLNLDEKLIENAITEKTRAIVPVHYAGVGCDMHAINKLAKKYNLAVVEDAAQGLMASYDSHKLGTLGDLGCFSFHATKNIISGEGGALIINNKKFIERAEIIREKGTNRSNFLRGQTDKYSWVDLGSSFLPNEITAAFLFSQLEQAELITNKRLKIWDKYHQSFQILEKLGHVMLPKIPKNCLHNGHMYFLILENFDKRNKFISVMKERDIQCTFHYLPLHLSKMYKDSFLKNKKVILPNTEELSKRIVRIPLFLGVEDHQDYIIENIINFFQNY